MEEDKEQHESNVELTPKDVNTIFCILLKLTGGISISQNMLDKATGDMKWSAKYDEANKRWYIFIPQKRKRDLILPNRKIIVPN